MRLINNQDTLKEGYEPVILNIKSSLYELEKMTDFQDPVTAGMIYGQAFVHAFLRVMKELDYDNEKHENFYHSFINTVEKESMR